MARGRGYWAEQMGYLKAVTLESLHPAWMMTSPQPCRWSSLPLTFQSLYTLEPPEAQTICG